MRVLLVSAIPPPEGGIATWTNKYLEYCQSIDVEIEFVNTALQGSRRKQINTRCSLLDEIKRTYYIISEVKKYINNGKIDVIHINSSCSKLGIIRDYLCVKAAVAKNISVVLHCHCNVEDQIVRGYGLSILKKMANLSSIVLVLNRNSYNFISKITNTKIEIIPNFIEQNSVSDSHEIREQIKEIVFVGHVQVTKGCVEIIRTACEFPDIHFTLVGPVNNEIRNMQIPKNVEFVGAVPTVFVKNFLSKADLFLFPSYTEGFSLSLMEAMANGLPCIASDVGANKDMLEDKGGIIIEPRNSDAIIDAVKKLSSYENRFLASQWNIQKVKNAYLQESVMGHIFSLYEVLIENAV